MRWNRFLFLCLLSLPLAVTCCATYEVIPSPGPIVDPVNPVDPRPPTPPRPPAPVGPVLAYDTTRSISAGDTRAFVTSVLGQYTLSVRQDDGTLVERWPAVDVEGGARWLLVQYDQADVVIGKGLVPRAP